MANKQRAKIKLVRVNGRGSGRNGRSIGGQGSQGEMETGGRSFEYNSGSTGRLHEKFGETWNCAQTATLRIEVHPLWQ